jgi:serine protease Do
MAISELEECMDSRILDSRFKTSVIAFALALAAVLPARLEASPQQGMFGVKPIMGGSYLGIEMENVTAENMGSYKLSAERGVIVRSVEKRSPAEAANLQEKDVILEYAGMPVFSTMQLSRLVQETPEGRGVNLVISRDGKKLDLNVKLGKREGPHSPGERPEFDFDRSWGFGGPGGRAFGFEVPEGGLPFGFSFPPGRDEEIVRAGRPRLGVTLQALTDQMGEYLGVPDKKGALVTSVAEGSAAAAADLKAGDVIVRAGEKVIANPDDLSRAIRQKDPGEKLELKAIRDKKEISLTVELPKDEKKSGGFRL